jgi:hypothetical protein
MTANSSRKIFRHLAASVVMKRVVFGSFDSGFSATKPHIPEKISFRENYILSNFSKWQ